MKTIVIAPHPDDETLGTGGTLLRRKSEGAQLAWLLITTMRSSSDYSPVEMNFRDEEIKKIKKFYNFDRVYEFGIPAAQVDQIRTFDLVKKIGDVFMDFEPNEIFIPHTSDSHSDHRIVSQAALSCVKWFRYPFVCRVLAYETLSETDFGLVQPKYSPNLYIDIGSFLEKKLDAMRIYKSELQKFPFPRSIETIRSLAMLRGSAAGYAAAESFELLMQRE